MALNTPDSEMDDEGEYGEEGEDGEESEYNEDDGYSDDDEYSEDTESEPEPSSMEDDETAEVRTIDSETLSTLMNTQLPDAPMTAGTLDASTQPENDDFVPTAETYRMAARTASTAEPIPSSTSQPSMSSFDAKSYTPSRSLLTAGMTPSKPNDDNTFEVVLSSRPPLPPGARNAMLLATQPSSDVPTPQELRTVIEALLELSQTQKATMPKPYSLPTTKPAAEAPQSQPSAARSDVPEQLSMSVKMSMDEPAGGWDFSAWSAFEAVFSPAAAPGPTRSRP